MVIQIRVTIKRLFRFFLDITDNTKYVNVIYQTNKQITCCPFYFQGTCSTNFLFVIFIYFQQQDHPHQHVSSLCETYCKRHNKLQRCEQIKEHILHHYYILHSLIYEKNIQVFQYIPTKYRCFKCRKTDLINISIYKINIIINC